MQPGSLEQADESNTHKTLKALFPGTYPGFLSLVTPRWVVPEDEEATLSSSLKIRNKNISQPICLIALQCRLEPTNLHTQENQMRCFDSNQLWFSGSSHKSETGYI